jgi:TfoX/Sxy family transcriptional regulator of competence genes
LTRQVVAAVPGCGRVNVRRIGRLCGVFHGGASADAPVGFVFGGEVYLKAGPEGITRYIACGMRPFRPGPRQPLRGYWRVPADVLADPAALRDWAAAAVDAVRRFGKRPRALRRRRRPAARDASAAPDARELT